MNEILFQRTDAGVLAHVVVVVTVIGIWVSRRSNDRVSIAEPIWASPWRVQVIGTRTATHGISP